MKADELRAFSNAELASRLDGNYQELFNMRFQKSVGRLTNTARVSQVKRENAQIMTILRERELGIR